jgi:ADP-heptose:LPS heptosyltransferase
LVALNLSARKIRQRWPAEHFVALARTLHERHGCSFMLVWSPGAADNPRHPGDDAKAAEVLAGLAGLPVTALRTVRIVELIAGLSLAHAMISADGGAMHLGAACGLPVVALFGNSEPALWHPWRVPHEVLQHPARDVSMISVAEVVEAWERLAAHAAQRAGARSQSRVRSEREGAPRGRLVASR